MNFVSGIPVLFGWVMYTGGPKAAFANWTMVGGFSCIVSLVMAELGAALPTTGGIYFWSYRLGGEKYGPFLSWMTAWWNVCERTLYPNTLPAYHPSSLFYLSRQDHTDSNTVGRLGHRCPWCSAGIDKLSG